MNASTPELHIEGAIATLTLRRPQQANRLEPDDLMVISEHVARVNATPEVLVLRLQAGGKTFCAGYDIGQIGAARPVAFEDMVNALEDSRPVTMVLLQGGVYGGATDLALCCDIRIGVAGTRMFMPAARFGLHYYPGGLRRYVAAVGAAQAKRIFLTGQTLGDEDMLRIGFLTDLVPRRALKAAVAEYIDAVKACEPSVQRSMKRQIDAIAAGDAEGAASRDAYEASLASPELRRRLASLAQKRRRR
jgi:enoyl-CoA hydratase/carnithine racemase